MNEQLQREAVQSSVQKKFRGRRELKSKVQPQYPQGIEREYVRVSNAYMRILGDCIKEHFSEIAALGETMRHDGFHEDADDTLSSRINIIFRDIMSDFRKKSKAVDLIKHLTKIGTMTKRVSTNQWKRIVNKTLGVDLLEDYYLGSFYGENLGKWIGENVGLIKSVPEDALQDMRSAVCAGYMNGKTYKDISREIQQIFGVNKRHAEFIARDQTAKLNCDITKAQQLDAGVTKYRWSTSGDGRVRRGHSSLNKKEFEWNNPPIVDSKSGRRGHPGQDYRCRCVAIPVFEFSTLNLPIAA